MKYEFVKTANSKLFRASIASAEARGAKEASLMTVTGRPGEGKSHTLLNWAHEGGHVMLTAQVDWTPRRLMVSLAEKLGLGASAGQDGEVGATISRLRSKIIVDEAGFCLRDKAACLDKLRGITDASKTLLILVFMPDDANRLKESRFKQLNDRISERCEFQKSTRDDVARVCAQLSEVPIAPCLVEHLCKRSDTCMRLILNAISRIEGEATLRAPELAGQPVTLAEIAALNLFKGLGDMGDQA